MHLHDVITLIDCKAMLQLFQINANKRKMAKKQRLFREKRDRLYNELIPQQNPDVMDPDKESILSLSVNDLLAGLKSGNMDPVAVLEAYQVPRAPFTPNRIVFTKGL